MASKKNVELEEEEILQPKDASNGEKIPSFFKLMKDVLTSAGVGADVTKIRIPAAFCYPFSLLEFIPMKRLRGAQLLESYEDLTDPKLKMALVVKWYLACVTHDEYGKKPWNPVQGETFMVRSESTYFFSEQVSHHPPVSAFHFENRADKMKFFGYTQLEAKFTGNAVAAQTSGYSAMHIGGDVYEFSTLVPVLHARNLVIGSSRNEYGGSIKISGPDSHQAHLEFVLQGLLGGGLNGVKGTLLHDGNVYSHLEGSWDAEVKFKNGKKDEVLAAPFIQDDVLFRSDEIGNPKMHEIRHERQLGMSSREVWAEANTHLRAREFDEATTAKSKVEDKQRAESDAMREEGTELDLKLFEHAEDAALKYKLRDDAWNIVRDIGQDPDTGAPSGAAAAAVDDGAGEKKKKKKKKEKKAE